MTPEHMLLLADACCSRWRVSIRDYAALAAAGAAASARIDGIPVHATHARARAALENAIRRLEPLSARNDDFALVAGEVFARLRDSEL